MTERRLGTGRPVDFILKDFGPDPGRPYSRLKLITTDGTCYVPLPVMISLY